MKYQIENTKSGLVFGIYEAGNEEEALNILAKEEGHKDWVDLVEDYPKAATEILVTEAENQETKVLTVTLPEHWASALINMDYSGLDEDEEREVKQWMEDNLERGEDVVSCSEHPFITSFNGLLTNCLEYHILGH